MPKAILIVTAIFIEFELLVDVTAAGRVFDPAKCQNGCKNDDHCPTHALCVPVVTNSDCGICVCHDDFTPVGNTCRNTAQQPSPASEKKAQKSKPQPQPQQKTARSKPAPAKASKTTSQYDIKANPRALLDPEPIDCAIYECGSTIQPGIDSQPNKVRTQIVQPPPAGCKSKVIFDKVECSSSLGSTPECHGVACISVSGANSYCICSYNKIGEGCNIDKPGRCYAATGLLPLSGFAKANSRYHPPYQDQQSVIARHFVADIQECVKLCQWMQGGCKSVNVGPINGKFVCELLSIQADPKNSALQSWVQYERDWFYTCCF